MTDLLPLTNEGGTTDWMSNIASQTADPPHSRMRISLQGDEQIQLPWQSHRLKFRNRMIGRTCV